MRQAQAASGSLEALVGAKGVNAKDSVRIAGRLGEGRKRLKGEGKTSHNFSLASASIE